MRSRLKITLVAALACALLASAAAADEKDELKQRFQERYPKLQELKRQGKVGETFLGYIDAVKPEFAREDEVKRIIGAENNDRRRLYEIIAKEQDTTADHVGRRNAQRNFSRAGSNEWLRTEDNRWVQKKDLRG